MARSLIKRLIAVLLAVSLSLIAAVGVSADDGYMDDYTYVAYDSFGLIYFSRHPLSFFPAANARSLTTSSYKVPYILVSDADKSDPTDIVYVLKPIVGTQTVDSFQVDFFSNSKQLSFSVSSGSFNSSSSVSNICLSGSSSNYTSGLAPFIITLGSSNTSYSDVVSSYKVTANYAPYRHYYDSSGNSGYPTYGFGDNNFILNSDLKLGDLISGGDAKTIIIAISAAIDSMTNTIINTGSDYIQFIPTQAASDLESSVSSITSAEGVLKDKSSSLSDSVSDQMSDNVNKAKALVTTLKPAAAQITNVYNSFLTVLPDEIKAMFIAIPLLLFIGWLIGRIRE